MFSSNLSLSNYLPPFDLFLRSLPGDKKLKIFSEPLKVFLTLRWYSPIFLLPGEAALVTEKELVACSKIDTSLLVLCSDDEKKLVIHYTTKFELNLVNLLTDAGFCKGVRINVELIGACKLISTKTKISKKRQQEYQELLRTFFVKLNRLKQKTGSNFSFLISRTQLSDEFVLNQNDCFLITDKKILKCSVNHSLLLLKFKSASERFRLAERSERQCGVEDAERIFNFIESLQSSPSSPFGAIPIPKSLLSPILFIGEGITLPDLEFPEVVLAFYKALRDKNVFERYCQKRIEELGEDWSKQNSFTNFFARLSAFFIANPEPVIPHAVAALGGNLVEEWKKQYGVEGITDEPESRPSFRA